MRNTSSWIGLGLGVLVLAGGCCAAESPEKPPERIQLYSKPDPSAKGGIKGVVVQPRDPIEQILAIPSDEPRLVYEGQVSGPDRRTFAFTGLPMRKYDLLVVYRTKFIEGLQLLRGRDTLTEADRVSIKAAIEKSEPFFLNKDIHRMEGESGDDHYARVLATYLRDKGSGFVFSGQHEEWRRTFKLVILKDVGPGWQISRARDLYPVWTTSQYARPEHLFHEKLSQIRVTDYMKDLGDVNLEQP